MWTDTGDSDLVIVRQFRTTPAVLFEAWTDPAELALWMGPEGVAVPEVGVDLRPDGEYRIVLRFAEGVDYAWGGRYLEIRPPHHLSFSVEFHGENGVFDRSNPTIITVDFAPVADGTQMIFRQSPFPSGVHREAHANGWLEAFAKLEALPQPALT